MYRILSVLMFVLVYIEPVLSILNNLTAVEHSYGIDPEHYYIAREVLSVYLQNNANSKPLRVVRMLSFKDGRTGGRGVQLRFTAAPLVGQVTRAVTCSAAVALPARTYDVPPAAVRARCVHVSTLLTMSNAPVEDDTTNPLFINYAKETLHKAGYVENDVTVLKMFQVQRQVKESVKYFMDYEITDDGSEWYCKSDVMLRPDEAVHYSPARCTLQ